MNYLVKICMDCPFHNISSENCWHPKSKVKHCHGESNPKHCPLKLKPTTIKHA